VDLLYQIAGVKQIGLARARGGAAHIHARNRAFGAEHGRTARGTASVGELTYTYALDAGDMPLVGQQILGGVHAQFLSIVYMVLRINRWIFIL
jgi:hypothetical protein